MGRLALSGRRTVQHLDHMGHIIFRRVRTQGQEALQHALLEAIAIDSSAFAL